MKKVGIELAVALVLIGILNFSISLGYQGFIKYVGVIGSTILIVVETIFIIQKWQK